MRKLFPKALYLCLLGLILPALLSCRKQDEYTADGRLILNYWEKWTGFEREAMERIVNDYNQSQDRVFVRFVSTSQIDRKLLLATAGGNPPDVAGFWSHSVVNYAEKGALHPLDRLMERDGLSIDDYIPSVIDSCMHRGFVWGLPSTPATVGMHYNKTLLAEAGFDGPPRTLEEMDIYTRALNKTDASGRFIQMGFLPTDPGWWGPMFPFFFGLDIVSEDGETILSDTPEIVEVFEWFQSFVTDFGVSRVRTFEAAFRGEFASSSDSFMSGRIAMKLQGVWMANFIKTFAPDMEWGAAPFPAIREGMEPATVVESDILVIPRGTRHVEEAWNFIKFVQERENMEKLCLGQQKFSPLREVSDGFYEGHPNPYIRLFRELAESPNARGIPKIPVWAEFRDEMAVALDRIWVSGEDPATALRRVRTRVQPKLDRANARWEAVRAERIEEWSNL